MLNTIEPKPASGPEWLNVGNWRLDVRLCRLTRGQEEIRLEPKITALLAALCKRTGEPVTRHELMQEVWGHLHVTDDALNRLVGRLRNQLHKIDQGIAIETLPRVGYRLQESTHVAGVIAGAVSSTPHNLLAGKWTRRWPIAAAAVAVLLGVSVILYRSPEVITQTEDIRASRPLTTLPGMEVNPSFAPNGSLYFSHRDDSGFWHIYRRDSDASGPTRVTEQRADDFMPIWRADGRGWAFLRRANDRCQVYVWMIGQSMPRSVADCGADNEENLDWSPDGSHIVFSPPGEGNSTLALLDLASRQQRPITQPPPAAIGDAAAAFSPAGDRVAFVRWSDIGVADVFVTRLSDGAVSQITSDGTKIHGLDWVNDQQLVFASDRGGSFGLWRVDISDGGLQHLPVTAREVANPTISADGNKIAYESWNDQADVLSLALEDTGKQQPEPLIDSTRWDWGAVESPLGDQLAFVSDRSGNPELWVSELDGSQPRRVTHLDGAYVRAASWSPDGAWLAFEATAKNSFDIFLVNVAGDSPLQALVSSPFPERGPRWSADGRAVYFGRKTNSYWSLHRILIDSAVEEVVVANSGTVALEDSTGRFVYFTDCLQPGFWRTSMTTGVVEKLLDFPAPLDCQNWKLSGDRAFLLRRAGVHKAQLHSLDLNSGAVVSIRALPNLFHGGGLEVNADRVLYSAVINKESDLMLQVLKKP